MLTRRAFLSSTHFAPEDVNGPINDHVALRPKSPQANTDKVQNMNEQKDKEEAIVAEKAIEPTAAEEGKKAEAALAVSHRNDP